GPTVCARGRNTHAARFTIEAVLASPPIRGPGPMCAALCIGHPGDRGRTFRVPDPGRPQFGTQGGVMTDQSAPGELIWQDGVTTTCQSGAPPALSQISMGVAAGEVVAVVGPSGCGKSTPTIQPWLRGDIMHPMFKQLFLGTDDLAAEEDRRRRVRRPGQN